MKLQITDLIMGPDGHGTPWEVMHCGQLAAQVLGRPAPQGCAIPREALEQFQHAGVEHADERVELAREGHWVAVGTTAADATRVGDVLLSKMNQGPSSIHLAVLVDDSMPPMVLTTTEKAGAHCIRRSRVGNVVAVYRWRGSN